MIYYGVVAKNTYVIADYTKYDGDFPTVFQQIINSTEKTNKITVYTREEYSYYIRHNTDGFAFGCLASVLTPTDFANKFLENLQARVYAYIDDKACDPSPHATSSVFTKLIKSLIVIYRCLSV